MRGFSLGHLRKLTVLAAAILSLAMGLGALMGWALQVDTLKSVIPGAVQMKPNTAVGLVLAALALLAGLRRRDRTWRLPGYGLALAVLGIGLATLCEYLFAWDLNIDELLFRDVAGAYNVIPGRMSPFSAWTFLMLGVGLCAVRCRKVGWLAYLCGFQALGIGLVSLLGYLWHAAELVTDVWLPPVAVNTGLAFTLLGLAVMAAHARSASVDRVETDMSPVEVKVILAMLGTLVLLIASAGYSYRSIVNFSLQAGHLTATQQSRLELRNAVDLLSRSAVERRAEVLSPDPQATQRYQSELARGEAALHSLALLESGNGARQARIEALNRRFHDLFAAAPMAPGADTDLLGEEIDSASRQLLAEQQKALEKGRSTMLASLIVTIGLAVAVFVALMASVRREMGRNARVRAEISELNRHLEQRVRDRTVELDHANHHLSAFMDALAHDLRQPLVSAGGFGDLLDKRLLRAGDVQGRQFLQRISRAMKQVDTCTDALLVLGKVSRATLWFQTVDVCAMAETVMEELRAREPGRKVRLRCWPGRLARADQGLLNVVLWHLIDNAWKFTAGRSDAEMEIGCGTSEEGVPMWWVKDNGAGFDMRYVDKLFIPFQRLHAVDEFAGLGTGLAIVDAVIARHKGKVWAHSEVGRGATFFFTLGEQPLLETGMAAA